MKDLSRYQSEPGDKTVIAWPVHRTEPNLKDKDTKILFNIKAQVVRKSSAGEEAPVPKSPEPPKAAEPAGTSEVSKTAEATETSEEPKAAEPTTTEAQEAAQTEATRSEEKHEL